MDPKTHKVIKELTEFIKQFITRKAGAPNETAGDLKGPGGLPSGPGGQLANISHWATAGGAGDFPYASLLQIHKPFSVLMIVLYAVSITVALFGNICLLGVLLKARRSRSQTWLYLLNLALCDILLTLLCVPFTLSQIIYQNWIYGGLICRGFVFGQALFFSTSIFTLTLLSISRSIAASRTVSSIFAIRLNSRKFHRYSINLVWACGFVVALPLLVVTHQRQMMNVRVYICREDWSRFRGGMPPHLSKIIYSGFQLVFLYIVPLILIAGSYIRICLKMTQFRGGRGSGPQTSTSLSNSTTSHAMLKQNRRVFRLSLSLIVLFAISCLPLHLMQISLDLFNAKLTSGPLSGSMFPKLRDIFLWLALSNSAVNPVFIFCTDTLYQRELKNYIRQIWTGKLLVKSKEPDPLKQQFLPLNPDQSKYGTRIVFSNRSPSPQISFSLEKLDSKRKRKRQSTKYERIITV